MPDALRYAVDAAKARVEIKLQPDVDQPRRRVQSIDDWVVEYNARKALELRAQENAEQALWRAAGIPDPETREKKQERGISRGRGM